MKNRLLLLLIFAIIFALGVPAGIQTTTAQEPQPSPTPTSGPDGADEDKKDTTPIENNSPSATEPEPQDTPAGGETIIVPFENGTTSVQTSQSYQGLVNITVSGTGQASGTEFSDAFYIFTDSAGQPITPIYLNGGFALWINGGPAENFVQPIPPFNENHVYTFQIDAPGGPLTFAVGDTFTADNSGEFIVTVGSVQSDVQIITAPIGGSVLPLSKLWAEKFLEYHGNFSTAMEIFSVGMLFHCLATAAAPPVALACVALTLVTTGIWEGAEIGAEVILDDPPRDDYDQIFELEVTAPIEPFDNSPFAQAWASFLTKLIEYTLLQEAYLVTLERLQGAIAAEEVSFIILQSEALTEFTNLLIDNQEELRNSLELLGVEFNAIFDSELQDNLARLASDGLSTDELQLLEDVGATEEEIQAIKDLLDDIPENLNYGEFVQQGIEQWINLIDDTLPTLVEISTIVQNVATELDERAPKSHGYWNNHSDATQSLLPVTLGNEVVDTVSLAQEILEDANAKDASNALAAHLLTAELNVNSQSLEKACILPVVSEAQDFLIQYPRGSNLTAKNKDMQGIREEALTFKDQLDEYNNLSGSCFE